MAPPVAGAIAKIQQTLDRSGIQFKVRLEQDKAGLLALSLDFVPTRKRRAGVALSRRCQALSRQPQVSSLSIT